MSDTAKTALVTGASRGLGYHIAHCLAARGYRVTLVARSAEQLTAAVRKFPGSAHDWVALDLAKQDHVTELARRVERDGFDVLVNNAGAAQFGPVSGLTAEAVTNQFHLNLVAPALLSRAFVKSARPGAVLVNVTSIVGRVPMPGNAVYSAAKAGLQALTECLWYEARSRAIRVLDFRPVSLNTDFHQAAGGRSMTSATNSVDAHRAASDLVEAVERNREFVYSHGPAAWLLELASRLLPRKLLVQLVGHKSRKAKYL